MDYEPFFSASQVKKNKMLADIGKLERQKDAATFIIEARMGLWDIKFLADYGDAEFEFMDLEKGKGAEDN